MVLVVEVEDRSPKKKCFLGGWRHTVTGSELYNACTQTHETLRKKRDVCVAVTQTVDVAEESTNVARDRATQVHNLPELQDKILKAIPREIIVPRENTLSPVKDLDECARKIQRYYRAYRVKSWLKKFLSLHDESCEAREKKILTLPPVQVDFALLNASQPKTKNDFHLLREMLNRWRRLEHERVNRLFFKSSRIAACGIILSKEVEMLRAIDFSKTVTRNRQKEKERCRFLYDLSKPLKWKNYRGDWITVYTPFVEKAQSYRETYESLCDDTSGVLDRRKLLLRLSEVSGFHCCAESTDLSALIDQELRLLSRDVEPKHLSRLRSRLKLSFLRLARNVLIGDSKERVLARSLKSVVAKFCESCASDSALSKFSRDKGSRLSTCRYCPSLRTTGGQREFLYEPYERVLRELRRSELKEGKRDGLAFAIGAPEIRQLVNSIWLGKSPLSECNDIEFLRLARFQRDVEWSPWNCILLTKSEAAVHRSIENVEEFYADDFLRLVKFRNLRAKLRFNDVAFNVVSKASNA